MKACYICDRSPALSGARVCKACAKSYDIAVGPANPATSDRLPYDPACSCRDCRDETLRRINETPLEEARRVMRLDDKFNKYMPHYGDDLEELPF
jgi:hypothetical protein